jgi:hypothetical protein
MTRLTTKRRLTRLRREADRRWSAIVLFGSRF